MKSIGYMMEKQTQKNNFPIINASLNVVDHSGNPAIQFFRRTTESSLIKLLVDCALNDKPVLVTFSYKNKLLFISDLIEKGIINYDDITKEYKFTF